MTCNFHPEVEARSEVIDNNTGKVMRCLCRDCEQNERMPTCVAKARPGEPPYMTRDEALLIEPGMKLRIRPGWSYGRLRVHPESEVLAVNQNTVGQVGVSICVNTVNAGELWLDAAWFLTNPDMIPL